jgi:hypothetical protein
MTTITHHNDETQRILDQLPREPFNGGFGKPPNAYVYIDHAGRLCALLASGEWLGTEIENVEGDQAPFCG